MIDDPLWPRASAWLAGEHSAAPAARVGIIGAPLRLGSITPGRCDLGPEALRKGLHRFSTYDFDEDLDIRSLHARDLGDLPLADVHPETACGPLSSAIKTALEECQAVVVLGGDNSVTRGGVHGLGQPLDRCGLLTIDAHLDLRHLDHGLSNGNPVRALLADGLPGDHIVQIGIQSFANSPAYAAVARDAGIRLVTVEMIRQHGIRTIVAEALGYLSERVDGIYIDLDLDVMDRAHAPGTPGARPGGLTPAEIRMAAHQCGLHPKVGVMDMVELDPTRDENDVTALAGAACLLSFASGLLRRCT